MGGVQSFVALLSGVQWYIVVASNCCHVVKPAVAIGFASKGVLFMARVSEGMCMFMLPWRVISISWW